MKTCIALFGAWLIGMSAWAQLPAPGAAAVDSRDECAALEGTWKPAGNGWQSACEVPWSRDDCLRLGGGWTQVPKAGSGGRCRARISELAVSQQCMERGGNWAPVGSGAPQCTFVEAKARVRNAPDAGKLCSGSSDCSYGCAYSGPEVLRGMAVQGKCRPTPRASGCFSMVEAGKSTGRVCVQ